MSGPGGDRPPFELEEQRGKVRLLRPRPGSLGALPADRERDGWRDDGGRFASRNRFGAERGVKAAAVGSLRAARSRVKRALAEAADPAVADEIGSAALTFYAGAARDLNATSILVVGPLVKFAANQALSDYFAAAAGKAGLTTEEGARLLGLQHACENRAERSMTMAIAAAKALAGGKPKGEKTADRIRRAAGGSGR